MSFKRSLHSLRRCFSDSARRVQLPPRRQPAVAAAAMENFAQVYPGQPSPRSHPHWLKRGEIMPGVSEFEFAERRAALVRLAAECLRRREIGSGGKIVAVVCAPQQSYSAPDVPNMFRQDSNMTYLCGFLEPGSVLIVYDDQAAPHKHRSILFVAQPTAHSQLWDGPLAGVHGAVELTGVDEAHPLAELPAVLQRLVFGGKSALLVDPKMLHGAAENAVNMILADNAAVAHPDSLINLIHELRWIKSPSEVQLLKKAAKIGSEAVAACMLAARPKMLERQLVAHAQLACVQSDSGCRGLAYPPVVASGDRCGIIHYMTGDMPIGESDLILMDVGADYWGYVSDITRTWPASGTFSNPAREVYQVLYELHNELLEHVANVRPLTLNQLYVKQMELTAVALVKLGIMQPDVDESTLRMRLQTVCPHHVSHYLGMDVHDTATVSRNRTLQPNVVITVEPGLYFPPSPTTSWVPPELSNVGMRIEDDLVLTDTGVDVLTRKCPSRVQDIEEVLRLGRV